MILELLLAAFGGLVTGALLSLYGLGAWASYTDDRTDGIDHGPALRWALTWPIREYRAWAKDRRTT